MEEKKKRIEIGSLVAPLWAQRRFFYKLWIIVFIISYIWVAAKPRFYTCEVKLAPETTGSSAKSSLASLASTFGLNLGSLASQDAIHPMLYPELMQSPEFVVKLLDIEVSTFDGEVHTDYYTYLKDHQKKNWLTSPIGDGIRWCFSFLSKDDSEERENGIDPFCMSKDDYKLVEMTMKGIKCSVDKRTNVISITVQDQDKRVCALMADSIKTRLQAFILDYRTKKARQDAAHYKQLTDSTRAIYETALMDYSLFRDGHKHVSEYTISEEGERLKKDLDSKYTAYNAFNMQYTAALAKVQEETPSFTTLKSATVPQKPSGPKRLRFVAVMLFLSTTIAIGWKMRKELREWF